MSSTTAGTVTAASPTSSYAEGRPRSRGRPSAHPLPNLGSAGLGPRGGRRPSGAWGPWGGRRLSGGVGGLGWTAAVGGVGALGWTAAGQRDRPLRRAQLRTLCWPLRIVKIVVRVGRGPHAHLDASVRTTIFTIGVHCELAHVRERRSDSEAESTVVKIVVRGGGAEHAQARGSAFTTIFTSGGRGGPHGIARVRGRVCRRRPRRTASLTCAAAYAAVGRPVRHRSRTRPRVPQ